jgi:ribosomal protein L25 (general stress protein Ctc)
MTKLRSLARVALLAVAASPAAAAEISVTDPADRALAIAIDEAVNNARNAIAACRDAGGSVGACYCEKKGEIALIRSALDSALATHPEWKNRALTFEIGQGAYRTILLNAIARMAEPPKCN